MLGAVAALSEPVFQATGVYVAGMPVVRFSGSSSRSVLDELIFDPGVRFGSGIGFTGGWLGGATFGAAGAAELGEVVPVLGLVVVVVVVVVVPEEPGL